MDEKGDKIVAELEDDRDWSMITKDALVEIRAEIDKDFMSVKLEVELAERVFTEGTANEWWGIAKTPETLYAIFERRMREILVCFLSSATVGTLWDGREITKGGMIVVTKLGDVVCLELASRDELGKYLVRNCTLESPSTTKMDWGHVIERDGRLFVRMHLNVRFV